MDVKQKLFFEFYRKYYEPIYIFVYYIMDCKEDAEDIVQDTFYKSYGKFLAYYNSINKNNENAYTWLKALSVKTAVNYKHKRKLMYINKYIKQRLALLDNFFAKDTADKNAGLKNTEVNEYEKEQ